MAAKLAALPQGVQVILDRLQRAGEQAYAVGGCVRDSLLGRAPHDWDLCTSAVPERVKEIFSGWRVLDTGPKHGTVSVQDAAGAFYEITTFRTESGYSDGRRPDAVRFVADVREDLARRDFTVNAMAYSPQTGLIDPFGGEADLAAGRLRCVGDAHARFAEDALRILRAVRFCAQLGFSLEPETARAMRQCADRLKNVSAERVGSEFRKIVCAPHAARAIDDGQSVVCRIVPEMAPLIGCRQNNPYHCFDVFHHTLRALESAERDDCFPREWADDALRLALFFHDFGKPEVRTTDANGCDHFYGHAPVSARIAAQVLRRLRFGREETETVAALAAHHDVDLTPQRACVRRRLNQFGEAQLRRLLKLRACDTQAQSPLARPHLEEQAAPFAALLDEVLTEPPAFSVRQLAVNGRDLLALGVPKGPAVGAVLQALLGAVLDGKTPNEREPLLALAKEMSRDGAIPSGTPSAL